MCTSCKNTDKKQVTNILTKWTNKEILFPNDAIFFSLNDTIALNINKPILKIITYVDALGCIGCQLKLKEWDKFNKEILSYTNERILVIKFLAPKRQNEAFFELKSANYRYPVCIDLNDEFNKINNIPSDNRFRCFLLDETNHVLLIGNPINNPQIKKLYIRIISERLGIKQTITTADATPYHHHFDTFPYTEPQQTTFVVHNTTQPTMQIDSVYTSCECTTATIDKTAIAIGDSAVVTIKYQAEKPEDFLREIYVDIHNNEQIVMQISGTSIDN